MPVERRAVELLDETSAVDDADPRGEAVDLGEDVARHEDGDPALVARVPEELADLDDAGRVQAVSRLVEHEQLGLVHEGAREREALEVAERQRPGSSVRVLTQGEPLDQSD